MAEGGDAKAVMARLRSSLEAGAPVEIGGYILMPALANALGVAEMPAPGRDMRVRWIELSQRDDSSISPLAAQQAAAWQAQGLDLRCHSVSGPTFWQTIEIETAPALLGRSVEVVQA